MSYKPIDDRQVINRLALSNIGSPANDSLDDILNKINALLAGVTNGAGYIAKQVTLTAGTTSLVVTIPSQPDLSYVVLPQLENLIDANPQFQQLEVTAKSTTGFTISWNAPLSSSNYTLTYIVPLKSIQGTETPVPSSVASDVVTLNIPQNGVNYGIVGIFQNLVDSNPQFQTPVITAQTSTTFTESFDAPTASANYSIAYISNPTAQLSVSGSNFSIVNPVPYGSSGYATIAVLSNITDANPEFQPLVVTAKNSTGFTVSVNTPTLTSNYILTYYAISLTI